MVGSVVWSEGAEDPVLKTILLSKRRSTGCRYIANGVHCICINNEIKGKRYLHRSMIRWTGVELLSRACQTAGVGQQANNRPRPAMGGSLFHSGLETEALRCEELNIVLFLFYDLLKCLGFPNTDEERSTSGLYGTSWKRGASRGNELVAQLFAPDNSQQKTGGTGPSIKRAGGGAAFLGRDGMWHPGAVAAAVVGAGRGNAARIEP